jgi:hypothetical protein
MNVGGGGVPELFIKHANVFVSELVFVENQTFADQGGGSTLLATGGFVGKLGEKIFGGHQAIRKSFLPDCVVRRSYFVVRNFVNGDEELAAFGVENYAQLFRFIPGVYIGGDAIEGIDCDDFGVIGQGKCFRESYSYTQTCEAAWADGDIDVLDLVRLFVESAQ